jgi:hypothetical protein
MEYQDIRQPCICIAFEVHISLQDGNALLSDSSIICGSDIVLRTNMDIAHISGVSREIYAIQLPAAIVLSSPRISADLRKRGT